MNSVGQAYRIYAVLVGGYIVSQVYRVSNAAIAPEMMRTLHLSAEEMGALTGMFFFAFGLMQIPTGMLLDRFGPRYTMSGLLLVAAAGSAIFASADGLTGLSFGRALMGVGCAAGLMGSMVVIGRWFHAQRFPPGLEFPCALKRRGKGSCTDSRGFATRFLDVSLRTT